MIRRRQSGLTLIEALIAASILSGIGAMAMMQLQGAGDDYKQVAATTDANQRLDRLENELRRRLSGSRIVTLGGEPFAKTPGRFTTVRYRPIVGFDAPTGAPVYGPLEEIAFVYDANEGGATARGNGIDDDRDGLADEGRVVIRRDANDDGDFNDAGESAPWVVLAHGIANTFETSFPSGCATPQTTDGHVTVSVEVQTVMKNPKRRSGFEPPFKAAATFGVSLRN